MHGAVYAAVRLESLVRLARPRLLRMALAGVALPGDWGWLPLAFSAGLVWRPSPPAVQVLCPESAAAPTASRGFSFLAVLAAFAAGLALGRLWGFFGPSARFRRAPRPLFP